MNSFLQKKEFISFSLDKYLYIHGVISGILNILCFFVYMDFGKGFPWFMYTLTGSVLFFIIHYDYEFKVSFVFQKKNSLDWIRLDY